MADRKLRFLLSATDQGAGKTLADVGSKGEAAGHKISDGFSKLGGIIGGEVGSALSEVGDKLESFGKGNRIAATGAALGALGGVLSAMGSGEQQASQQLDLAIKNSGHSAEAFGGQIEETVKHMERFGISAVDTKQSLQTLVNATHDPEQALKLMGEAADLAAAKHISLQAAATQLARVIGGHGAKTLAAYNIELVKNADGTTNWAATNQKLADILHGQAAAAADTFTGRIKALRTEVEDNVAVFGQKYGPSIMAAGIATSTLGPLVAKAAGSLRSMGSASRAAAVASAEGSAATVAADERIVVANEAAAVSEGELAAATRASRLSMLGMGSAMGIVAGAALVLPSVVGGQIPIMKELDDQYKNSTHSANMSAEAVIAWASANKDAILPVSMAMKDLHLTSQELAGGVSGSDEKFKSFVDTLKQTTSVSSDDLGVLNALHGSYKNTAAATSEATGATKKVATAQQSLAAAADAATTKMQDENDASGLLSDALNKLNDKTINAEEANIAFKDSVSGLNAVEKQNGHTLSDNTVKGRANVSAVLSSIKAAQAHAEAVGKQTGSVAKATSTFEADRAALARHLISLGFNRDAVQRLIDKYGQMPAVKLTRAELDAAAARAKADALQRQIDAIRQHRVPGVNANTVAGRERILALQQQIDALHGKTVKVDVYNTTYNKSVGAIQQGGVKANAGGTDFFSGGMTTIAEREPEAIFLPRGARVTPASRMDGGHQTNVNVTINVPHVWAGNSTDLGRSIAGALEQYVGAGGKIRVQKGLN